MLRGLLAVTVTASLPAMAATTLPDGLVSPDSGVVCQRESGVCYDRFGPSIGLTEAFLGPGPAHRLAARLRGTPGERAASFSPAEGVECLAERGPCRAGGQVQDALTALLYDPPPPRMESAEARALTFGEWQWRASLYRDETEARPDEPERYTVAFGTDGRLSLKADCNMAGGRFRLAGSQLSIEVTQSTRAACPPDSLDETFLRDLASTTGFFLKDGTLYFDLSDGLGTMQFERPD